MQTPYSSIANQKFSVRAYLRLRESLINQGHFFESVTTPESVTPTQVAKHIVVNSHEQASRSGQAQAGKTDNSSFVADLQRTDFVLMRSPTLNVLLTATPLVSSAPNNNSDANASIHHLADGNASSSVSNAAIEQAHLPNDAYHASLNSLPLSQRQSNIHHAPYDDHTLLFQASFSNPKAESEQLEPAAKLHNSNFHTAKDSSPKANRYLVNLTLDSTIIEELMTKLQPGSTAKIAQSQTVQHKTAQHKISFQHTDNSHLLEEKNSKRPLQETFFLSWAKDLATSPEGDRQTERPTTLKNEIEQSLLLNQVINHIRHSLDLSSILETTVAQVREFLSADRLVLYQFNSTDDSKAAVQPRSSHQPIAKTIPRLAELDSLNPLASRLIKSTDEYASQRSEPTNQVGSGQTSDDVIGQQSHMGQVTYESRRSEEISSVLNFAEESCFYSTPPNYLRYLAGQPIAVDNVDEKYANESCLLDFLHQAHVKSKIIVPILVKEQLWGLLIVHQCRDYRHWQETETVFLQHIAEHLAVAIEQASLYEQLQQQKVSLESCVIERTQSLRDALSAATAADRTKVEFLSTMSHELRTPLTYIIGMSATLLRWSFGELSERQRSYLETINRSGEHLLTVINDILEFAKVESGRSLLNVSNFPLSNLVRSVATRYQEDAKNHDVSLSVDCVLSPEVENFRADSKRIEQILSNLVNNAIKFTPAGGEITLRVQKELDSILLQVEDTGIGIPESQQKFMFEKFKQLESPFQRQYAGTGLGLAMTKHLVELHNGTIQVISTVGKGSTFIVSLPIQSQPTSDSRYHVPSTLDRITKPVVLLLETEENSAVIICELLTADGYEVIWLTPVDGIATQIALLKPALLIADLSLFSHQQAKIKEIEQSIMAAGTRVLALLSQSASQSSHIAHHDTLDKPIDPKQLIKKTRQLTSTAV
ncbi:ATPase, histidine kinase-, DNA gyrase B-, and HSP90-like domain protein [Synechococcus sp. PCC 7335]|uniref:GAF domain-containing sensor histidine kinase n=1 Tax=Synechococcus sp. (strain ATCC 29403 / PCC 7335) TaxID=91464 RepID=UPI00017ED54F|nr:GAF domain-containing hybrid sensor histidine kinase/response regulator [Synechococcus sp. PCC 7335]EDX86398.1 ATPase, histidine kinase-, DNA gyrase B-, and HSP90-like domain protein [Synechococcus sp. PCC 7335]